MMQKFERRFLHAVATVGTLALCFSPIAAEHHHENDGDHQKIEHQDKKDGGAKKNGPHSDRHSGHKGPGKAAGPHRAGGQARHDPGRGGPGMAPKRIHGGPGYEYRGHHFEAFHGPHFHWPHGYAYQRFHVGHRIPHIFLHGEYFVPNYDVYGLEPPPHGLVWLRYGPDMMLVDPGTGDVVRIVFGVVVE